MSAEAAGAGIEAIKEANLYNLFKKQLHVHLQCIISIIKCIRPWDRNWLY